MAPRRPSNVARLKASTSAGKLSGQGRWDIPRHVLKKSTPAYDSGESDPSALPPEPESTKSKKQTK